MILFPLSYYRIFIFVRKRGIYEFIFRYSECSDMRRLSVPRAKGLKFAVLRRMRVQRCVFRVSLEWLREWSLKPGGNSWQSGCFPNPPQKKGFRFVFISNKSPAVDEIPWNSFIRKTPPSSLVWKHRGVPHLWWFSAINGPHFDMGVSKNRGTPKTPQNDHF